MALFRTEFNLLKKLGEGHDAKVYLVKHVKSGKEMALKCLENPVH
jgi:serine/threonine protein kinase